MIKPPEQIQRDTSDLIQKIEKDKADREALANLRWEIIEEEKRKRWEQIV